MEIWKIALILLVAVWILQSFGTWIQMRHFRGVMAAITDKWADGHLGAGNARGRLGKGVIAIVVVDPMAVVRKVLVMEGRSVLAKFHPLSEYEGIDLAELKSEIDAGRADQGRHKGRTTALTKAIDQLERVKKSATESALPA